MHYGRSLAILFACVLGGTVVLLFAQVVGWGNTEDNGFYFFLTFFYFPMSGTAYLVLFALISLVYARWVEVPARTAPPLPTGAKRYVGAPWEPS